MEQKKKRKRAAPAMVHTAVVLPQGTIDLLKQSERGLSEEIRRRLTQSLMDDAYDAQTRELAAAVMWMADQIKRDTMSAWHQRPKAHEALARAIQDHLTTLKPKPEPKDWVGVSDLLEASLDPQTLGHAIARHFVRFKEALQKSEKELRQLHKGEKP
jgi:hypothetical protein